MQHSRLLSKSCLRLTVVLFEGTELRYFEALLKWGEKAEETIAELGFEEISFKTFCRTMDYSAYLISNLFLECETS